VSPVRAAVVVARREFSERVCTRAFQISIAVTLLIVGAVAVLAGVLGDDGATEYKVGVQGAEATAIAGAARSAAPGFDARVEVRRFRSSADARAAVRDDSVDAAVSGGVIVTRDQPPDELEQLLQAAARQVRAGEALRSEGVTGQDARRALDPPPLRTRALEGEGDSGDEGVAFTASLLLYLQLIVYGYAVASGVVEEKSSRVVEVLLATIPPRSLLAGKIIGIGLLGLLQLLLTAVVGLGLASASGAIELSADDAGMLAVVLVWFLLGYLLWACLYAMAGAIVSRQEDLQSSTTVLTLILVASYLVAFPALDDLESSIAVISSLFPLSSPIIMPVRVAVDAAGTVEIIASLGLLVVGIALLVRLGPRIYENAVLAHGQAAEAARGLERVHALALSTGRHAGVGWRP
jgi:ABC-2 type transport system permease protein